MLAGLTIRDRESGNTVSSAGNNVRFANRAINMPTPAMSPISANPSIGRGEEGKKAEGRGNRRERQGPADTGDRTPQGCLMIADARKTLHDTAGRTGSRNPRRAR